MADVLSIALSGLTAQQRRVGVAANNIANAGVSGRVPTPDNPASTVYRPQAVSMTAILAGQEGGGVGAEVVERADPFTLVYDPADLNANAQGLVALPNVDFAAEIVDTLIARTAFKANAAVIRADRQMRDDLLDVLA